MQKVILSFVLASALALPLTSQAESWSLKGHACLGPDHNTLVEELGGTCKQGDIIATKYPAYFCDFNYTVAFNTSNSAICVYRGDVAEERVKELPQPNKEDKDENAHKFTGLSGKVF